VTGPRRPGRQLRVRWALGWEEGFLSRLVRASLVRVLVRVSGRPLVRVLPRGTVLEARRPVLASRSWASAPASRAEWAMVTVMWSGAASPRPRLLRTVLREQCSSSARRCPECAGENTSCSGQGAGSSCRWPSRAGHLPHQGGRVVRDSTGWSTPVRPPRRSIPSRSCCRSMARRVPGHCCARRRGH